MSFASVIGKIFGSKSERDYKAVKPTLDKILAVYPEIDALSDDDIRARSAALRARLVEVEQPFEARIAEIKQELDKDIPVSEKEKLADPYKPRSRQRLLVNRTPRRVLKPKPAL